MNKNFEEFLTCYRKFRHKYTRWVITGKNGSKANGALEALIAQALKLKYELSGELKANRKQRYDYKKLDKLLHIEDQIVEK